MKEILIIMQGDYWSEITENNSAIFQNRSPFDLSLYSV